MTLPKRDVSSCSLGVLTKQSPIHPEEEKLYSLHGLLGESPTTIQKSPGDYSSFIRDFSTQIRSEPVKMDENYEWWKVNCSKYSDIYKGQYVLVAEKRIITSDKSLGNLETIAKSFPHYIIFSVGVPITKNVKVKLGFPYKIG